MQSSKPRKSLPPIVFLGGKGGVGKTTLAAALAFGLAEQGERTLLVSTDPAHSLADLLERALGDREVAVAENLFVRELDPEWARDQYLGQVLDNIRHFTAPEFLQEAERQVRLAGDHPGVMESALFEALCRILDESDEWDRIIIDTAPTGHTLHLLTLPESMQAWTESLLARQSSAAGKGAQEEQRWEKARQVLEARRHLFERTRALLSDESRSGFALVVNDDRLSVLEGERTRRTLEQAAVPVPFVLINRVSRDEKSVITEMQSSFPSLPCLPLPDLKPRPQGLEGLQPMVDALRRHGLLGSVDEG